MATTSIEVVKRKDKLRFKARIRQHLFGRMLIEVCKTHDSRSKAELWLAEAIQIEENEGTAGLVRLKQTPRVTVGGALKRLFNDKKFIEATSSKVISSLKQITKFSIAKVELSCLAPMHLVQFCEERKALNQSLSPATLNVDISNLSSALKEAAVFYNYSFNNQIFALARPTLRKHGLIGKSVPRQRRLRMSEEIKMENALRKSKSKIPMKDIVDLAKDIGVRRSELTKIRWSDFDRAKGTLVIRERKSPNERKVTTKLTLNKQQIALIEKQLKNRRHNDNRIFPYNDQSISAAFRRAMRDAKISDYQLRDLKAHAITSMFERGKSVQEISKIVGNRDPQILVNHYFRADEDTGLTT